MKPIESTAEILAFKMLGRSVNKKWIDWAYDMLVAGFDTDNLVILAGELEPYNQFELQSLTDKVFKELELTWNNREQVLINYIGYLVGDTLAGNRKYENVLAVIKDIYLELNCNPSLEEFYLLYYANEDLSYSDYQYYWDGATRENINEIIKGCFIKWRAKCDSATLDG